MAWSCHYVTGYFVAFLGVISMLKSGWNMKKIFCCPAIELFHCLRLPLWKTVIHYLEKKVGVVDFANAQGMVMFWSPRARQGPRALKLYQSAGFWKIYYSHFIFEVIRFLSKVQNYSKKLSNYGNISKIGRKNHYLEFLKSKIWKEKPLPWNFAMK